MPSKPGRPATKGSWTKDSKPALGNDKTLKLSTWIDKELDTDAPQSAEAYGEVLSKRRVLSKQIVDTAISTRDVRTKLEYFKEIADRTEGRPVQQTDVNVTGDVNFRNMPPERLQAIIEGKE